MGANFNNATPSRPAAPVVYTVAVAELSGCWIGACRGVYYSHSYFGKLCDFRWDRCIGLLCVGSVRTHMRNSATALPLSIQTITKMAGASSHAEINGVSIDLVVHIKRRLSGRATAHNIREYCGRRGLTVRFPVLSHLLLFAPPLSIGTPTDSNISGTCVQYKAPFGAISGPPHTTPCNVCHVWWLCPESQITQLRGVVFRCACVW
jgi:hypothetical protein